MERITELLRDPTATRWITVLIGLVVILITTRLTNKGLSRYVKNNSLRYSARKFIGFLGFVIFCFFAMITFNYKLSSLTLALGVAGAGIAFALQEIIVSMAGFLAVLFGNFYKVGDRVQLGGIKGDVVDIGVLRTTLMELGDWVNGDLYNGKMVRVANSFIFKEPVYNYSGDFPFLWDEIRVPVRHGADIEFAKTMFLEVMNKELGSFTSDSKVAWENLTKELYVENAQIEPMVSLTFDENWITFTLRYVVDFKRRRITKDKLFSTILIKIEENQGKVKIATAAMEITQV